MSEHLKLPGVREFFHCDELTRSLVEGVDSGEDGVEKTLSDALSFEFGYCAKHHRTLNANCLVSLNHILPPPANENRWIFPANDNSSCLVSPPCHRATLASRWFGLPWRHTTRTRRAKQRLVSIANRSDLDRRRHSYYRNRQNTVRNLSLRAGATPRTFWAAESRKSGVAPARFGVFSTVTFPFTAFYISYSSKKLLAPQGEETGEDEGGVCSPYLLHPFSSGFCSGTANRQSTSVAKCTVAGRLLPPKS